MAYEILRECPFCGGSAKGSSGQWTHYVRCTQCGCSIEGQKTIAEAKKAWNMRGGKYIPPMSTDNPAAIKQQEGINDAK